MMRSLCTIATAALLICACVKQQPAEKPPPSKAAVPGKAAEEQKACAPAAPAPEVKPPTPTPAPPEPGRVRAARFAGSWYPGGAAELRAALDGLLSAAPAAPADPEKPVIAVVAPHAGIRYSGATAARVFSPLKGREVRRFFLLGPSHRVPFEGVALPAPDLKAYGTPLGDLLIDRKAVDALRGKPGFGGPAQAHDPEHSLEMEAIFLAALHPEARLVPLVVGGVASAARAREVAVSLRPLLGEGDVVVVSSDFTHYGPRYGYVPFTEDVPAGIESLLDKAAAPLVEVDAAGFDAHLDATKDTICGREPLRLLLALLPEGVKGERVASDTSGRMTGDFSNSVSYLSVLYRHAGGWGKEPAGQGAHGGSEGPTVLGAPDQQIALRAVRKTLEVYLSSGKVLEAADLGIPDGGRWKEDYGTFVTLKKDGHLRGCIGHTLPVQALWKDIRDNAISAAVKDRRFRPVQEGELEDLHIEVSILTRPEPAPGPQAFVVGRHGVILNAFGRGAVYLPQVAPEQGWDRDTTLTHLARKAGLPLDAWRKPSATLSLFEAQVFGEHR